MSDDAARGSDTGTGANGDAVPGAAVDAGLLGRVLPGLEELGGVRSETLDQVHVTVPKERIVEAVTNCRRAGFELLSDVMGLDWLEYPGHQGSRFTVVYNLYAIRERQRLMLRVSVEDEESVPSLAPTWRAASFMEREVYDMFGIEFEGHPDLRKLLTPEDLDGYPHRKDFPLGETPTLFNDGRFIDPVAFRAGLIGTKPGLTGWRGGARRGVHSAQGPQAANDESDYTRYGRGDEDTVRAPASLPDEDVDTAGSEAIGPAGRSEGTQRRVDAGSEGGES